MGMSSKVDSYIYEFVVNLQEYYKRLCNLEAGKLARFAVI